MSTSDPPGTRSVRGPHGSDSGFPLSRKEREEGWLAPCCLDPQPPVSPSRCLRGPCPELALRGHNGTHTQDTEPLLWDAQAHGTSKSGRSAEEHMGQGWTSRD